LPLLKAREMDIAQTARKRHFLLAGRTVIVPFFRRDSERSAARMCGEACFPPLAACTLSLQAKSSFDCCMDAMSAPVRCLARGDAGRIVRTGSRRFAT